METIKAAPVEIITNDACIKLVLDVLNEAFILDPNATHSLICNRVPCNANLANHNTIIVESAPVLSLGTNQMSLFRIYDKEKKKFLTQEECGTHCFSNYFVCPFTGVVVNFVGCFDEKTGATFYSQDRSLYYFESGKLVAGPPYILQRESSKKDAEGRAIFEGDIIKKKGYSSNLYNYTIRYYDDCFLVSGTPLYNVDISQYVVIGNIFETPELD